MSDKKLKQQRDEEEQLARQEKKRMAAIHAPLFGRPTKAVKVVKETVRPTSDTQSRVPSNPNSMMGLATKPPSKVYTGTKIIGIAAMHKSNLVPIFNDQAAVEVAQMRRN